MFDYFASNLREPLFNGLLSLGAFLFAAQTFIVIHMKSQVYETDAYRRRFDKNKQLDSSITLFGPLRKLSDLLYQTVCLCVIAALLQLTVGLIPHALSAIVCIVVAVASLWMLARCMFYMRANMTSWLNEIEDEAKPQQAA